MLRIIFLVFSVLVLKLAATDSTQAQQWQNVVPPPVYRQYEDTRRYNAAPASPNYYDQKQQRCYYVPKPITQSKTDCSPCNATKVRTVKVRQYCQSVPTYDACGSRICRQMTVTLYKDYYSDGRTRIWQHVRYSS